MSQIIISGTFRKICPVKNFIQIIVLIKFSVLLSQQNLACEQAKQNPAN